MSAYASVIDIDRLKLPSKQDIQAFDGPTMAASIRHVPSDLRFNASVRQLLHVSFKLAAKAGTRYLDLLHANQAIVSQQVTDNLFERHLKPIFVG